MFKKIMEWLAGKPEGGIEQPKVSATNEVVVDAPYKIETPVVVTEVKPVEVAPKVSAVNLEGLDKKALLAKAKELGISVNSRMTKDEIKNKIVRG
jgi:hypothetical protein